MKIVTHNLLALLKIGTDQISACSTRAGCRVQVWFWLKHNSSRPSSQTSCWQHPSLPSPQAQWQRAYRAFFTCTPLVVGFEPRTCWFQFSKGKKSAVQRTGNQTQNQIWAKTLVQTFKKIMTIFFFFLFFWQTQTIFFLYETNQILV